jgi:hypothetical protein
MFPPIPLIPKCGEISEREQVAHGVDQLLTQLHFEDGIPMIREDYDGIDGTPRGCADYLHSTYIDLVVRYALGVDPSRKEISDLQPMLGLDASIEGFPLGGKLLFY